MTLTFTFWGVRGTTPSPGAATARYGGNTTCASLQLDDRVLVIDGGSGLRLLGKSLARERAAIYLVLTHLHWDHIQGLPLFLPFYQPQRPIHLLPVAERDMMGPIERQMDGVHYPVQRRELAADLRLQEEDPGGFLAAQGLHLSTIALNHPGGAFGLRIEHGGRSIVFLSDNELHPPGSPTTTVSELVAFSRGADLLIHDAQYLPADMPAKHGWGHSQPLQACALAREAGARHLLLTHHDPDRSDDELDASATEVQRWRRQEAPELRCEFAYEGLSITLPV